ncbi:MAG: TlpA family protein disulfide reductase [Bacteroidetes bacterium]|nr:TlpA family protein disulfide reductase [Bacteroidota bacterium]
MPKQRLIITLVLLLLLAAGGYYQYRKYRVPPEFDLNRIEAKDLSGANFNADDWKNQHLVIAYFATWCIDCRRELPQLEAIEPELIRNGVKVILLSDEDQNKLQSFSKALPETFTIFRLNEEFRQSEIYTLPTNYLIRPDGSIFLQKTGAVDWNKDLIMAFTAS